VGTLADDHTFVKEPHDPIVALDALALCDHKGGVATFTDRLDRAQWLSVAARKAEHPFPGAALCAVTPDDPLEISALGACVMLNGQLERDDPARVARVWPKKVGVVWVALRSDLLAGECLQV